MKILTKKKQENVVKSIAECHFLAAESTKNDVSKENLVENMRKIIKISTEIAFETCDSKAIFGIIPQFVELLGEKYGKK